MRFRMACELDITHGTNAGDLVDEKRGGSVVLIHLMGTSNYDFFSAFSAIRGEAYGLCASV